MGELRAERVRRPGPDQLKGVLLFLVIFGHTLVERSGDDPLKWALYGFHMPAFLYLSGYLISADRLLSWNLRDLLAHYWTRMLAAWIAVSALWAAAGRNEEERSLGELIVGFFLLPEYHLWYIPLLMLGVLLAWALVRSTPGRALLLVAALLGYLVFRSPVVEPAQEAIETLFDERYATMLLWFVLGLYARNGWLPRVPMLAAAGMTVLGAVVYGYGYGYVQGAPYSGIGFLLLNLGVTSAVPTAIRLLDRRIPLLSWVLVPNGQHSLWVYLLHPFATEAVRQLELPPAEQLGVGLAATVAIMLVTPSAAALWGAARPRTGARRPAVADREDPDPEARRGAASGI